MRGWLIAALMLLTSCTDSLTNPSNLLVVTSQATSIATEAFVDALPTQPSCPATNYIATNASPITWTGDAFLTEEQPFKVHGIVLNETIISGEFGKLVEVLRLIADAGFNTITVIFDTVTLDRLFVLASEFQLRVIVSVSEQEAMSKEAMSKTAARYANEPTLLAWEITRTEPNLQLSLTHLANTRIAIRTCDNHPIMTAWEDDLIATAPLVDLLGLVHWEDYEALRQQFASVTAATDKPILLARIGYDANIVGETGQRSLVFQALEESANYKALGWTVFSAFDGNTDALGIWDNDLKPRLVLEAIQRIIARDQTFTPSS